MRPRRVAISLVSLVLVGAGAVLPAAAHAAVTLERTSSATFYVDGSTFSDAFPKIRAGYVSYRIANDATARDDVWVKIGDLTGSTISLAPNEDDLVHIGAMASGEQRTAFFYLQSSATTGSGSHTIRVYDGRPGDGGVELSSGTFALTVSTQGFNNANKVSSVTVSPASPSLGGLVTVVVHGETGTIGSASILSFTPSSDLSFPAAAFQLESTQITFSQSSCPSATRNCSTLVDTLLVPPAAMPSSQNTPYTATYRFRATNVTTASTAVSPLAYISSGQSPSHTSTGVFASLPPIDPVDNTLTLAKSADRSLVNATETSRTVQYTVTVSNTSPFPVSFDDVVDTIPAGAAYVPGSAAWGGSALPAPSLAGGKLTFVAPFTVPGAATRALAYRLVLAPENGTATNSAIGHSSSTRLDTTLATTDDSPAQASVVVDVIPPPLALTGRPAPRTNATSATFVFSSTDLFASFECLGPGSAVWAPCASGVSYSPLGAGTHAFSVRATDLAGNATVEEYEWVVDLTTPTIGIAGPSSPTPEHEADFTFTSDEPVAFWCALDGGPEAACASPFRLENLPNGEHVLTVRAVDEAGNETVETFAWEIDGPPIVVFQSGPAAVTSSSSAELVFAADRPGSTLECKLDAGAWAPCTSPLDLTGLAEGEHTVLVRATAATGTGDPSAYTWTVDLTAPETTIESGPSSPAATRLHVFTFSAGEPVSFECRWSWDDGDFWPCVSGDELDGGRDGFFSLQVRAVDAAGNVGEAAEWAVTIDTVSPAVSFTAAPADPTTATGATFAFSADEPVLFECSLDGAAFTPCSAPEATEGSVEVDGLAVGPHALTLRGTDAAGNAGERTHSWTVVGRPVVTFEETPGVTSGPAAAFRFSALPLDDETTYECSLDGGVWGACASPLSLGPLADGPHSLAVRAVNEHGTGEPTEHEWTADATAPGVEITSAPAALVRDEATVFAFTSDDETATFECSLDDGGPEPCTSPHAFSVADGEHTFRVRARDGVGNESDLATHAWTVDTQAPSISFGDVPPELASVAAALFSFSSTDPAALFECSLDDDEFAPCESPLELGVADGPHRLAVRALDPAGNLSETVSHAWTVDTTAPSASIPTGPASETTATTATFTFASDDEDATFFCGLDGAEPAPCESPLELTGLAPGPHTLSVTVVDAAGNESTASWTWAVVVPEPPLAAILSGPESASEATDATFVFTADREGATFECSLEGAAFAPCTSPVELTGLAPGAHEFRVRALDDAGTGQPDSYAWTVTEPAPPPDPVPASASITGGPAGSIPATDAAFTFGADQGEVAFECSLDDGAWVACESPLALTGLAPGEHTLTVRALNDAGAGEPDSWTWTVLAPEPGAPALALEVAAAPGLMVLRRAVPLQVLVRNPGEAVAEDVTVAAAAAAGVTVLGAGWAAGDSSTAPSPCPREPRTASCSLGDLEPGETVAVTLVLRADRPGAYAVQLAASASGLDALVAEVGGQATRCTIVGTPGNDRLVGTPGDDVICGLEGNDVIRGGGGRDVLLGGPGNDRLFGEGGRDRLRAGAGSDFLSGGGGADLLTGGAGDDTLDGGAGDDRLEGRAGRDVLWGRKGRDLLLGGAGPDTIHSHDGFVDRILGGRGRDRWSGDAIDRARDVERRRIMPA